MSSARYTARLRVIAEAQSKKVQITNRQGITNKLLSSVGCSPNYKPVNFNQVKCCITNNYKPFFVEIPNPNPDGGGPDSLPAFFEDGGGPDSKPTKFKDGGGPDGKLPSLSDGGGPDSKPTKFEDGGGPDSKPTKFKDGGLP